MQTEIIWLGNVCPTKNRDNPNQGRVYAINGIAPCLNTIGGGNLQPMILVEATERKDNIAKSDRKIAQYSS